MNNWTIKLSLFINYFVFAILLNSVGTVILQVQTSYGVSESAAAILEACKDLSIVAVSFFAASFLVKIGYRHAMMIGLIIVIAMCFLMPSFPRFWMNKLMFVAIGVSFSLIKLGTYASLGLLCKDKRDHASQINFVESFFMVGVLSGYFVFSWFVDKNNPASTSWLNVYYFLGTLSICALILLFFAKLDESKLDAAKTKSSIEDFVDMLKLAIKPLIIVFIICAFLYVLIEQSIMTWLPTFNKDVLNLSHSLSIQMASILALSTALGRFLAGFALRKINWYWVLVCALALAALLVFSISSLVSNADTSGVAVNSWLNAPFVAYLFPCIGLCLAPIYPAINSTILTALPIHQHAPMAGLIVLFSALGGTTGSMITGTLFEHFGGETAFTSSIVPIIILLIALTLFKRSIDKLPQTTN